MVKIIKNSDTISHIWGGRSFDPAEEYSVPELEDRDFVDDLVLIADIISGLATINDGISDITDPNRAINYLKNIEERYVDGRISFHQTSKPRGTNTVFTGQGDDTTDLSDVGGGADLYFIHNVGDPVSQTYYFDFNCIINRTYLHEGYVTSEGCTFDRVLCELVPQVTLNSPGNATNYNIVNGVIVPAAGNGTIAVNSADMRLVESLDNTGYWNATLNTTVNQFESIVPASLGDGKFHMFGSEVILSRFINNVRLAGASGDTILFQTSDSQRIPHGTRLKYTFKTDGSDHNWRSSSFLTLHRERTI